MTMISRIDNFIENPKAHIIFAHGAGADKSSSFMERISIGLNGKNINVSRFNFTYMDKRITDGKKYPPDRMPKLIACMEELLSQCLITGPLFLLGKSMGSRVAATLMSDDNPMLASAVHVNAVICLGYPFHPIGKPEKLRLEPIQRASKPVLVLQGERDKLGSRDDIENYQLSDLVQVIYFPDGDHDLKPRVRSGFTHEQHIDASIQHISDFIDEHI